MSARGSEVLDEIMLERMAKAMMEVPVDPPAPAQWHYWQYWLSDARAALEALREPTEPMVEAAVTAARKAGSRELHRLIFTAVWRAMIDAALREGEGEETP